MLFWQYFKLQFFRFCKMLKSTYNFIALNHHINDHNSFYLVSGAGDKWRRSKQRRENSERDSARATFHLAWGGTASSSAGDRGGRVPTLRSRRPGNCRRLRLRRKSTSSRQLQLCNAHCQPFQHSLACARIC